MVYGRVFNINRGWDLYQQLVIFQVLALGWAGERVVCLYPGVLIEMWNITLF
jgi:hypothetical protein